MANGQQEQQSGVVNQQSALNQPQNPEQDILQDAQQQQKPNLYQTITAMNPQQMLELSSRIKTIESTDEIRRNIGDVRASKLFNSIKSGEHTLESAVAQSKTMLSPVGREIDNEYFKPGMTADTFQELRLKHEASWSATDRSRFMTLWNNLRARDDAGERGKLQKSKSVATRDKALADLEGKRTKYQYLAQNDFMDLMGNIDEVVDFVPTPTGEVPKPVAGKIKDQNSYDLAVSSLDKLIVDVVNGEKVDFKIMNADINTIANNVPDAFIDEMKGYYFDGQFFPIPEKGSSQALKRYYLAQQWQNQLLRARDHAANIGKIDYSIPAEGYDQTQETGTASFWQK
jgi:hypothetical protein